VGDRRWVGEEEQVSRTTANKMALCKAPCPHVLRPPAADRAKLNEQRQQNTQVPKQMNCTQEHTHTQLWERGLTQVAKVRQVLLQHDAPQVGTQAGHLLVTGGAADNQDGILQGRWSGSGNGVWGCDLGGWRGGPSRGGLLGG
jgi:hypothetical protein